MRYLGLALFAEGPTDYRFLSPLLQRLCEHACLGANQPVEVSGMLPLDDPKNMKGAPREDRIAKAALDASSSWNVLFVHADGAADRAAAHERLIAPGLARLAEHGLPRHEGVAVLPIRETEAWMLADGDALRTVFGTTLDDAALGLPLRPALVEQVTDPKAALDQAYAATGPTGRRARNGAAALFDALGERVLLDRLRDVPSFRTLEQELLSALKRLSIL